MSYGPMSQADANQVLRVCFDEATNSLRTLTTISAVIGGTIQCDISAASGDNIALANTSGTNFADVTASSALKVDNVLTGGATEATLAAIEANQTSGSQKTQITDSSGNAADIRNIVSGVAGTDKGLVVQAVVNGFFSGGPTYVPFKVSSSGVVSVDGSATIQPVSGTVTANQGTANSVANSWPIVLTDTVNINTIKPLNIQVVGTDYGIVTNSVIHGLTTAGGGSYVDVKVTPSGALSVAATQDTSPWVISGTVTATQSGTWNIGTLTSITNPVTVAQATAANLNATVVGTGTFAVQAAQSGTWNINNISGTINLPTGAATESTLSTLSGKFTATTSASSTVSASTSSVTLKAANASRKDLMIFNNSVSAKLYVCFAATALTTSFVVRLDPGGFWEMPVKYTGLVTGIWDAAVGDAQVTELT